MKLIAIGDNVVDCYLDQMKYYPGGNCVNVAVNSKRNGAEEVAYIGVFGTDEKAAHLKKVLQLEKIDIRLSRTLEGISGQPKVTLINGDRVFVESRKDTVQHRVKIKMTKEDLEFTSQFDVCHISCYSNMEEELQKISNFIPISFDFSDQTEEFYLNQVCPHITYAFFSGSHLEENHLDEFAQKILMYGVEIVGITRGAKGAIFYNKDGKFVREPDETKVMDTMGAGDSFIAGFLTNYIETLSMDHALDQAAASSALTCQTYGGIGYPKDIVV